MLLYALMVEVRNDDQDLARGIEVDTSVGHPRGHSRAFEYSGDEEQSFLQRRIDWLQQQKPTM